MALGAERPLGQSRRPGGRGEGTGEDQGPVLREYRGFGVVGFVGPCKVASRLQELLGAWDSCPRARDGKGSSRALGQFFEVGRQHARNRFSLSLRKLTDTYSIVYTL